NSAQHHDSASCRIDAFNHSLPCARAGKSARSHLSLWRRRRHAEHARVLPREVSGADRIFYSAAKCQRVGVGGGGGAFRASFWGIGWLGAAHRHRLPDGAKSTSRQRRSKTGAGKAATILHCCSGMHLTRPAWLVGLLHARGPSSSANCTDNGAEKRQNAPDGGSARQT